MTEITSYSTLITAIGDTLDDPALSTYAPRFIQFAERMFDRQLFGIGAEGTSSATATTPIILPSDFKGVRSIYLDDYGPLKQMGADDFQTRFANDTSTGVPEYYAIINGGFYLGPPPDSTYTITLHYLRKLIPLTDTEPTNWILEEHPDLYLYASVIHAEAWGWNDDRLPTFKAAINDIMSQIVFAGARARQGALLAPVHVDYF